MPLIVPANEQGAGFMAAGYARASGRVGVVLVTSGPGATNYRDAGARLHGRLDSDRRDLRPGADARPSAPTRSRKRRSSTSWAPCAKHVFLVTDPTKLEATHAHGVRDRAHAAGPGPVVVDVPKDVQNWQGTFRGEGLLPMRGYRRAHGRAAQAARSTTSRPRGCSQMLGEAERPLIYAGGGVINGQRARRAARVRAARSSIPVVTTLMGIGAFDTTQPLSLHMLGMHGTAFANYAVDDCDFLICARRALRRPRRRRCRRSSRRNAKRIAHLDIDASEIDKVKRVRLVPRRPMLAPALDAAARTAGKRASRATSPLARRTSRELKRRHAHELRPRQRARSSRTT